MGNTERVHDFVPEAVTAPEASGARGVPSDWFVDPAESAGRFGELGSPALEDQATAFLAAHDLASTDDEAGEILPVRPLDAGLTAQTAWVAVPGFPGAEDEGELGWQTEALCAQTDPEAFFPEKGGSTRDAKKVCGACNVRSECLEYALANDERFGIWGGLSERERRRLRKRAV
jgi:WhiB family redox-sensing transcriptional regulator